MAEEEPKREESLMEKIVEKIHGHGHDDKDHPDKFDDSSSSSSDSDHDEKEKKKTPSPPQHHHAAAASGSSGLKKNISPIFGRTEPVHKVLGGGKSADIYLWREKKVSAGVLGGATAIYILFELLEYHLLTLVCHGLILALALLFLWSNASTFINKTAPRIPEVHIPEEPVLQFAAALRNDLNRTFAALRDISSGRDLKKFLTVIAGLWILSIVGNCCNFLTLFYIVFVLLHTVPVFYEKYEDQVDALAEKAMIEIKKQYAVFDEKVLSQILSKIPRGPLKDKKKV